MRNLFLRLEEFGNICGTNFCDLGPKSQKFVPQKLMPQHFMPAKINALKVAPEGGRKSGSTSLLRRNQILHLYLMTDCAQRHSRKNC